MHLKWHKRKKAISSQLLEVSLATLHLGKLLFSFCRTGSVDPSGLPVPGLWQKFALWSNSGWAPNILDHLLIRYVRIRQYAGHTFCFWYRSYFFLVSTAFSKTTKATGTQIYRNIRYGKHLDWHDFRRNPLRRSDFITDCYPIFGPIPHWKFYTEIT